MALTINTNVNAMSARRQALLQDAANARSLVRLSSGSRINSAADDAAGLAITDRMSSAIAGMDQARRNIADGTSLLQLAESAMAQVTDNLQRLRTLAVQAANATMSSNEKTALQQEAAHIVAQITQIGQQTMFNGQTVFSQDTTSIGGDASRRAVIDGLRTGWLTSAEKLIKQYYGLEADGAPLTINLNDSDGKFATLAYVQGAGADLLSGLTLNIDMADFPPINHPDGGPGDMYSDRIIAHEMVHAVMARTTGWATLPKWFIEGTAELIHGADERLAGAMGGGSAAVIAGVSNSNSTYEGAYVASRYLHHKLKEMGVDGGIKGIMLHLSQHQSASLSDALNAVTEGAYADQDAFMVDFQANGANFIDNEMDLTNSDTGAIGGFDADGGPERSARDVMLDTTDRDPDDPLVGFTEVFPEVDTQIETNKVQIQAGYKAGDIIAFSLGPMNAQALGLGDLDMRRAQAALLHVDEALAFVAEQRVTVGASLARLDSATARLATESNNLNASRSRIKDTDFAAETTQLLRSQILQQAASAMLTQANSMPNAVLALLR